MRFSVKLKSTRSECFSRAARRPDQIDDGIVLALLARARAHGFHAWVLPQAAALPMASRREDVLIRRP